MKQSSQASQVKGKSKERHVDAPKLESLEQINLNAAGLDVGASEIYACVPEGRFQSSVRVFSSFTADLNALAEWLSQCQVTTVAMESTGVYWIPVFQILEARGFEVYLVNAQDIKNVTGKKTDILDCQWIQQLLTYGLLHKSFRPDDLTCVLRSLVRHRDMLLRYRASHNQHIQKALHQMNLKLTNVLTDVTGQTGMGIIRDILAGVRDPEQLAQHRDHRCGKSVQEIALSLEGDYRREHVFALQQAVELYDIYTQKLQACDAEIEQQMARFEPRIDIEAYPLPPATRPRAIRPKIDTHPGLSKATFLSIAISHVLILILRPDKQDYQGTAVIMDVARELKVHKMLLAINKTHSKINPEALKQKIEETYGETVAGVFPLSEDV